ncbi:MAG: hypothetical protein J6C07_13180, partial [Lachnospiraceae bacterium]|nr:hypothetical protein [Lachnospiraceae bacterium]
MITQNTAYLFGIFSTSKTLQNWQKILLKEENMMKSFFKKLSLVMALAMVVSLVAPAGSAF